jgi:methionine synthase II (cobalamin-independent)
VFATVLGPYPHATTPDGHEILELRSVLRDQIEAGLGMVTDGHVRVPLSDLGVPDIAGILDAWELADDTVRELAATFEPGLEPPLVKACLVGPYSAGMLASAASRQRGGPRPSAATRRRAVLAAAEATAAAVSALFHAGAPVVQLAEDELTAIGTDDYGLRALAAEALARATADLDGHISLSVAGGSADRAGAALFFDAPFRSYYFDLIHGPDNWRLITDAPRDRGIVCGVADCRSHAADDEPVMIWAGRYAASAEGRGVERVGLAPSAGLELLPRAIARRKMQALAEAAQKAGLPGTRLAEAIDPRAVDARSAALGRFDADARPREPGQRKPTQPDVEP